MTTNTKIFTTLIAASFLLIIGIVLRYTGAADVSTTAEIQNAAPTIDTIRFATTAYSADTLTSTGILPNIGTTRTIHVNGTIHDDNGEADIASSTLALVFHKTSSTNTCTADNNDCYRINTCDTDYTQGSDTEITYNCEVPITYFIDATDPASIYESDTWTASVTIADIATAQGTLAATIEVNSLLALNLPDAIDYGTRSLGENSSSTTNIETVLTQRGNTKADVQVSGTSMSCSLLGTLPATAQKWALTDVDSASSAALTTTAAAAARNIDLRTNESSELSASLYWNIAIPASGVKGICTGNNTIAVIAQSNGIAWNPHDNASDISVARQFHYRTEELPTTGYVTSWTDVSGNARNVSGAPGDQPASVISSLLNSKTAARFDGSTDTLTRAAVDLGQSWSIFAAFTTGSSVTGILVSDGYSSNDVSYMLGAASPFMGVGELVTGIHRSNSWTIAKEASPLSAATGYLAAGIRTSGSGLFVYKNGSQVATAAAGSATTFNSGDSLFIGRRWDIAEVPFWNGDIAEIIAYNGSLSDTERQKIEGYLAHKYGLQSQLPSGHPYKTTAPTN